MLTVNQGLEPANNPIWYERFRRLKSLFWRLKWWGRKGFGTQCKYLLDLLSKVGLSAPSIAFGVDSAPALPDHNEIPVGLSPAEIAQLHRETAENAAECSRLLQDSYIVGSILSDFHRVLFSQLRCHWFFPISLQIEVDIFYECRYPFGQGLELYNVLAVGDDWLNYLWSAIFPARTRLRVVLFSLIFLR